MKKLLSVMMAVCLLLASLPVIPLGIHAAEWLTSTDGKWKYTVDYTKDNVSYGTLREYLGGEAFLTVPAVVDGVRIKNLERTFDGKKTVKQVTLSEGIEEINFAAFRGLSDLVLRFPRSFKYVGGEAVCNCQVEYLEWQHLEGISTAAFQNCTFGEYCELTLPDSTKYIGKSAFIGCKGMHINLGRHAAFAEEVTYYSSGEVTGQVCIPQAEAYDGSVFRDCTQVRSLTVPSDNPSFFAQNNVLYTKDKSILLNYFNTEPTDFCVPRDTKEVARRAFGADIKVNTLTIPSSLELLATQAVEEASVQQVNFEAGCRLRTIRPQTFGKNVRGNIIVPKSIERIEARAFYRSGITTLDFEAGTCCEVIEQYAFYACPSLKSVFIPNSVTQLGNAKDTTYAQALRNNDSFKSCVFSCCVALERVTFEDNSGLEVWASGNFSECPQLTEFNTGRNNPVREIYCGFHSCGLETLDFSECRDIQIIGADTFFNCTALTSMDLSQTHLTKIEDRCFHNCTALQTVILPPSVTHIGERAFYCCAALTSINYESIEMVEDGAFERTPFESVIKSKEKETFTQGDFEYTLHNDTAAVAAYHGNDSAVTVPDTLGGYPVTAVGDNCFYGASVTAVTLPESVTDIGNEAFAQSQLTALPAFPQGLERIGSNAFFRTPAADTTASLALPASVKRLDDRAFYAFALTEVTLNEGLEYIGDAAFYGTNVESVVFPDSVTHIGLHCFDGFKLKKLTFGSGSLNLTALLRDTKSGMLLHDDCLEEVAVSDANALYCAREGVVYTKDMTRIVYYPKAKRDVQYTVPEGVTVIEAGVFNNKNHRNHVPDYLERLVTASTTYCIEEEAFLHNDSLKEIYLSSGLREMGDCAFLGCKQLEKVTFAHGMVLDSLTDTFYNCEALKSVIMEDVTVRTLTNTFSRTALTHLDIPDSVRAMEYTFSDCRQLKSVTLPTALEAIGQRCFENSGLERVVLPEQVRVIKEAAFCHCVALTSIDIGNVQSIQREAFKNCSGLESMDLTGVSVDNTAFLNCFRLKKLTFTKTGREAVIGVQAFSANNALEMVVIGSSVNEIKDGAFADCANLKTAIIAPEVEQIADNAFDGCDKLMIVSTPEAPAIRFARQRNIRYTTLKIAPIADQTYTGSAIRPPLSVSVGADALTENEYTARYSDNIDVGTAKVKVTGKGDYRILGAIATFRIVSAETPEPPDPPTPHSHSYRATVVAPTYEREGYTLYTCDCGESFKDKFVPKKTVKATAITKLSKKKSAFTAHWNRVSGATGYQLQYSTKKSFAKKKTITVEGAKRTVRRLKKGRRYYVRVRAYKTVNGKRHYSKWSNKKSIRV